MSTLPVFEFVNAQDAKQAVAQLSKDWNAATIFAGGVDLLDLMKERLYEPKRLVNIKHDKSLNQIKANGSGPVVLGALSTLAEIAANPELQKTFPALTDACGLAATPQIRNMATLGGNLCQRPRCWYYRSEDFPCLKKGGTKCFAKEGENRYHAIFNADEPCVIVHPSAAAVALVALDARVKIASSSGEREVPLEQFFTRPKDNIQRENVLQPNELITAVIIPESSRSLRNYYLKQREKQSYDWPLSDVAIAATMKGTTIAGCRVVLGAVAPVPMRATKAEEFLKGKELTVENAARAGELAVEGATPLSQNGYKVQLVKVMTRRALMSLAGATKASS